MSVKFGHVDPQFSGVSRGPPAGSGKHPLTVTWVRQRKSKKGKTNVMQAHNRVGGRGQKFKPMWSKKQDGISKKAGRRQTGKARHKYGYEGTKIPNFMRKEVKTKKEGAMGIDLTHTHVHALGGVKRAEAYIRGMGLGEVKMEKNNA